MDTILVSKSEFKANALEYFRQIEVSGTSIIVTDHGKPMLEVRPYCAAPLTALDSLRHSVLRYEEPLAPVAEDEWEAGQ